MNLSRRHVLEKFNITPQQLVHLILSRKITPRKDDIGRYVYTERVLKQIEHARSIIDRKGAKGNVKKIKPNPTIKPKVKEIESRCAAIEKENRLLKEQLALEEKILKLKVSVDEYNEGT